MVEIESGSLKLIEVSRDASNVIIPGNAMEPCRYQCSLYPNFVIFATHHNASIVSTYAPLRFGEAFKKTLHFLARVIEHTAISVQRALSGTAAAGVRWGGNVKALAASIMFHMRAVD